MKDNVISNKITIQRQQIHQSVHIEFCVGGSHMNEEKSHEPVLQLTECVSFLVWTGSVERHIKMYFLCL